MFILIEIKNILSVYISPCKSKAFKSTDLIKLGCSHISKNCFFPSLFSKSLITALYFSDGEERINDLRNKKYSIIIAALMETKKKFQN